MQGAGIGSIIPLPGILHPTSSMKKTCPRLSSGAGLIFHRMSVAMLSLAISEGSSCEQRCVADQPKRSDQPSDEEQLA